MPAPAKPTRPFEGLIAPITADTFFAEHFETAPLIVPGQGAEAFDHILSAQDLSAYFDTIRHPQDLSVIKDGVRVPEAQWCDTRLHSDGTTVMSFARTTVIDLIQAGHSIRLRGAHRTIPKLTRFCNALALDLRMPLQVNVYISPPGEGALATHYDTHDVLALQLFGNKTWQLYHSPLLLPTAQQRYAGQDAGPVSQRFDLLPGDLAYIPRGLMHDAQTKDGLSIHLAMGLKMPRGVDLADRLLERLRDHLPARSALPHGYSTLDDTAARLSDAKAALDHVVASADPATLSQDLQQDLTIPVPDEGAFTALLTANTLTLETRVALRMDQSFTMARDGDLIVVSCNDRTVSQPYILEASLHALLDGTPRHIGDIPGLLMPPGKIALAKSLLSLGLIARVDAD